MLPSRYYCGSYIVSEDVALEPKYHILKCVHFIGKLKKNQKITYTDNEKRLNIVHLVLNIDQI